MLVIFFPFSELIKVVRFGRTVKSAGINEMCLTSAADKMNSEHVMTNIYLYRAACCHVHSVQPHGS